MVNIIKIYLTIYKSFFIVKSTNGTDYFQPVLDKLTTYTFNYNYKYKRKVKEKDKEFYVYDVRRKEYRFPIGILKDFMLTIGTRGVKKDNIHIKMVGYNGISYPLGLNFTFKHELRDYQVNSINDIVENKDKRYSSILTHQTGFGKTSMIMKSVIEINKTIGMVILPKFIDKWISDVKETTDIKDDELCVIQGGDSLRRLMYNKENNYKIYIFSTRTLTNYFNNYESSQPIEYPLAPQELMSHLGIGVLVNDESHMEFHVIYRCMLYFNIQHLIGSSATLISNDSKITYLHNLLFPESSKVNGGADINRYIDIKAVKYQIDYVKRVKYLRPQGYNHILFEQSIMRISRLLADYINMIDFYIQEGYIPRRKKDDKCLIFCSSIQMATILTNQIAKRYPKLKVHRYVEDDPYENILTGDITVATNLGASTGLDIPGLICCIQTVAIDSTVTNIQAMGRLRDLKNKEMYYYYLYCGGIDRHVAYHRNRLNTLSKIAKSTVNMFYEKILRTR